MAARHIAVAYFHCFSFLDIDMSQSLYSFSDDIRCRQDFELFKAQFYPKPYETLADAATSPFGLRFIDCSIQCSQLSCLSTVYIFNQRTQRESEIMYEVERSRSVYKAISAEGRLHSSVIYTSLYAIPNKCKGNSIENRLILFHRFTHTSNFNLRNFLAVMSKKPNFPNIQVLFYYQWLKAL